MIGKSQGQDLGDGKISYSQAASKSSKKKNKKSQDKNEEPLSLQLALSISTLMNKGPEVSRKRKLNDESAMDIDPSDNHEDDKQSSAKNENHKKHKKKPARKCQAGGAS